MKFYFGDMKRILAADVSASLLLCKTYQIMTRKLREIQHEKLFHLCGGRSLCECLKWCEDMLSEISPTDRAVVVNGDEVRFDN